MMKGSTGFGFALKQRLEANQLARSRKSLKSIHRFSAARKFSEGVRLKVNGRLLVVVLWQQHQEERKQSGVYCSFRKERQANA